MELTFWKKLTIKVNQEWSINNLLRKKRKNVAIELLEISDLAM